MNCPSHGLNGPGPSGSTQLATVPRIAEDLPGELLAPAATELVNGLPAEARHLPLDLAREAPQLALDLVAQGVRHVV